MSRCYREPTVTEALADPLIRLVMKADGVDPDTLGASLKETAAKFARHRSHGEQRASCCG